jgi:type I restriction enzyme, S subunit
MNAEQFLAHYDRIADAPDAVDQLRRLILDLAVRGKLVLQDPNDGPAADLLVRITAEKARLVKEGQIRKQKPFARVDDRESPFSLPYGWEWVRVREVTSDRGQTVPDRDFTYIDVTAINKEAGRIGGTKILSAEEAPSRARKIVQRDDVLYSCVRPYLLNIAVVEDDIKPPPIVSTAFAVLNGFGLVLPRYQWLVLRSSYFIACVEERMRGQAYPAINDRDFATLPFPLPPLAEQHRIVTKVDELMALCDRLEAERAEREVIRDRFMASSLARLSEPDPKTFRDVARFVLDTLPALTARQDQIKLLRQTILDLAVRGKLVPQDPSDEPASELLKRIALDKKRLVETGQFKKTDPVVDLAASQRSGHLPSGWALVQLRAACTSITDGDHLPPPKTEEGIPFLVIGNVRTQRINFSDTRFVSQSYYESLDPTRQPRSGDLLYTLVGSFGIPVLVRDDRPFCVQRHIGILRPSSLVDVGYLAHAMASLVVYEQAAACATGIAQKTVPLSGLRSMVIPLPPLAEQHRIVAKVDELLELCDQLEASLRVAGETRSRLLDALIAEALKPVSSFESIVVEVEEEALV